MTAVVEPYAAVGTLTNPDEINGREAAWSGEA